MLSGILLVFLLISWNISVYLFSVNPSLVVDEVYHVPQAQRYCDGNFSYWDPKITTPPGLYVFSALMSNILGKFRIGDACSVFNLRCHNVLLLSLLPFLVARILEARKGPLSAPEVLLTMTVPCFPVLYFTSFFYYTETLSVALVLIVIWMRYRRWHLVAAIFGAFSTMVRQTNIIWLGLIGADAVFESVIDFCKLHLKKKKLELNQLDLNTPTILKVIYTTVVHNMHRKKRFDLLLKILFVAVPYVIVLGAFVAFAIWNGGIVVGDKEAHTLTLHTPQILYFALFTSAMTWPILLPELRLFLVGLKSPAGMTRFLFLCVLCLLSIRFNSKAHAYLLADNRHYSFYVWKKILGHPWRKYALVPVYAACLRIISSAFSKSRINFLSLAMFFISVVVSLTFQELFDFRYFVIPYVVYRLHLPSGSSTLGVIELVSFVIINVFTIYVYSEKTFFWSNIPDPQRIIW